MPLEPSRGTRRSVRTARSVAHTVSARESAARVLWREEAEVRVGVLGRRQVRRADVQRAWQALYLSHESKAAVVWHVQPLVPVRDDRVGPLHSVCERAGVRGEASEQPECAVDV